MTTVAKVNGKPITDDDIFEAMSRMPEESRGRMNTDEGKTYLLNRIITSELLFNYAKDNQLEDTKKYKERLEAAARDVLIHTAMEEITDSVTLTDKELNEFATNNRQYLSTQQAEASHILVGSLEKANEVKEKLAAGMAFEDAAKQYSTCPSASRGGSLGAFRKGVMVPEFEQAAFAMEPGQISEPVKTQFGYHIIRLDKRSEADGDSVKKEIADMLLSEKKAQYYEHVLDELKKKYNVEIIKDTSA